MARGNWRNWDEAACIVPECDRLFYRKDGKGKGQHICNSCWDLGVRFKDVKHLTEQQHHD